jgi:hypothetical protein
MDPEPGSPKTYGSYGSKSGSGTLLPSFPFSQWAMTMGRENCLLHIVTMEEKRIRKDREEYSQMGYGNGERELSFTHCGHGGEKNKER